MSVQFVGEEEDFWSALAGGASYLIPTVAAVLLLRLLKNRPYLQSRMFMAGEALKVMLSFGVDVVVFCRMASIAGVFTVFVRFVQRQPFGFFSIVES